MELVNIKERLAVVALEPEDCLVLADALRVAVSYNTVQGDSRLAAEAMIAALLACLMAAQTFSRFVDASDYTLDACERDIRAELVRYTRKGKPAA